MRGVGSLNLSAGDYTITPAETIENWNENFGELLSQAQEGLTDGDGLHTFTIERADGTPVLEVTEATERAEAKLLITYTTRTSVARFRPPGGDPVLTLTRRPVRGLVTSYTLLAGEESIGTIEKSRLVLGSWQLKDDTGRVAATVDRKRSLGNLLSLSNRASYVATAPDGNEVAQLELGRVGGSLTGWALPDMEVSCARSSIPTEVCLVFAYCIFNLARQSDSSSSGGDDAE